MKFLFIATGSQATIYAIAPLAAAVQNEGHEILLAGHEPLMEFAEAVEIPAVSIAPETIRHFMTPGTTPGRPPGVGEAFARMASAGLDTLLDTARDWPPDVVVGGSMSYAAGLLATRLEVPYARHAEYFRIPLAEIDQDAEEGLRPELKRLGLDGLPRPDLFIDVCPPSLRPPYSPDEQPMRWIPRNPQRRLEPWMYTRPTGRPRVLITSGTHFRMLSAGSLRRLVDRLTTAGVEVLVAAPEAAAAELGAAVDDVRIGWIPLDVVVPTCDVIVHHGGATTTMTIMTAGVPSVIMPPNTHTRAMARALSDHGSAVTVSPEERKAGHDVAGEIAAQSQELLADPGYTQQAWKLAAEIATLPTPCEVVRAMVELGR